MIHNCYMETIVECGRFYSVQGQVIHVNMKCTYRSWNIGDSLCPAIREGNLVSSIGVVTITFLMGVEVGERVVIIDSVIVLVHWGEVGVGGFNRVWCRGSIGWGSCRGSASCCKKSGREESLNKRNLSLNFISCWSSPIGTFYYREPPIFILCFILKCYCILILIMLLQPFLQIIIKNNFF